MTLDWARLVRVAHATSSRLKGYAQQIDKLIEDTRRDARSEGYYAQLELEDLIRHIAKTLSNEIGDLLREAYGEGK